MDLTVEKMKKTPLFLSRASFCQLLKVSFFSDFSSLRMKWQWIFQLIGTVQYHESVVSSKGFSNHLLPAKFKEELCFLLGKFLSNFESFLFFSNFTSRMVK